MADIITLAQFDFDSDRLEKGIEALQKQLFELTKRQQELNSQSKEINKTLSDQTRESARLVQNFKNSSKEYQNAVQEQYKLKKAGQENTQAYKDLNTEKQRLIATFKIENTEFKNVNENVQQLTQKQEGLFLSSKDLQLQRTVLNKEYQTATAVYKQFIGVNGEVLSMQDVVNKSVRQEVTTREQAKSVNQQLNKIKDQLNITNEAELQLLNEINKRIDANNTLLKESGSENEKRIAGIGQYSEGIQDAASNLDIFNGGLSGFVQRSQEAGGAGNLVTGSLKQMSAGVVGVTKSFMVFLASPIGIFLALLTGAFLLVRNAMNRSEEATNKTNKVFGAFKGVLNFVLNALVPLGEILIDGIVKGFELATKAAEAFIKGLEWIGNNAANLLESIGFESGANAVRGYTNATTSMAKSMLDAANAGSKLAEMEAKLQTAQRKSEIIQEQYEVRSERLRQLRDDESKTIQERINANTELGKVLKQQLNDELSIAKMSLNVATARLQMEGATTANLEAQMKARTEIAKIENRITGQESEQQSNINSLRREAQAQAKAASDARIKQIESEISKQKEALELWIAQQGIRSKTLLEQYKQQEESSKKSIAILDKELRNKKISQEKYDLEVLKLQQERAKLQAEISVQIAEKNLDAYIYENQEKLKNGQLLTDALLAQELERNRAIATERDKFAKTQFENGLINNDELNRTLLENQRAYIAEEKALKEKNQTDNRTIEATRRAEEFQAQMNTLQENLASEFDIRKAQADFELEDKKLQLEQQRADGLITEANYQLALTNIIASNNQVRKQIEKDLFAVRLDYAQRGLDAIAEIAGKDTAAAKAVGVAKVGIDTAMAIMKSYSDLGPIGGSIFAAIVGTLGAINIKKIVSTKEPKVDTNIKGYATGGKITGGFGIKRSNGDDVLITAKRGEAILNEKQQSYIGANLLSLAGVPGFATGGVVGGAAASSAVQNNLGNQQMFDVDTFVNRVETAVQNGSQIGSRQGTENGSQLGISQLSSSRVVQGNSLV